MSAYTYIEDTLKIVMFFILKVFQVKQALYSNYCGKVLCFR